jgi:hypothetical protein
MGEITLPDGRVVYNVPDPQTPGAVPPKNPTQPRTMGDVGTEATLNAMPSAKQYARDAANAVMHPVQSLEAVRDITQGGLRRFYGENAPAWLPPGDTGAFDAAAKYTKDRLGSWENIKNTMATDPVGFAADLSVPLTMGGSLATRLPGIAGKAGAVVEGVGRAADPISAVSAIAGTVSPPALGFTTGAGNSPVREAARVAKEGTPKARADFLGNMRGTADPTDVLAVARENLDQMRQQRGEAYRAEMTRLGADQTPLQFHPIASSWLTLRQSFETPSGLSKASASTRRTLDDIEAALAEWEASPQDHTVTGLDALKQRVQDLYPEAEKNSQGQRAVTTMVNSIKGVIEQQAPQYKDVMAAYETESRSIREIEKALSLGDEASVDTAMRKLQSVMRNNVQTNYGQRENLVKELERKGGREIMPSLAGQSLNAWVPRNLAAQLGTTGIASVVAAMRPKLLPILGLTSPRAVGETTYALNRTTAELAKAMGGMTPGQAAFQSGRVQSNEEERRKALAAALAGN